MAPMTKCLEFLCDIEQKVVESLLELDANWQSIGTGSAAWTRAIKNAIGRLGRDRDFEVFGAQCDFENNGEWVFDLAWFETDGDVALDMTLALESEWDPRGVLEDFQKLLVSRARYRVMIFWQPSEAAWKRCEARLTDQIRRFKGSAPGDRYLLCCWCGEPDALEELRINLVVFPDGSRNALVPVHTS